MEISAISEKCLNNVKQVVGTATLNKALIHDATAMMKLLEGMRMEIEHSFYPHRGREPKS